MVAILLSYFTLFFISSFIFSFLVLFLLADIPSPFSIVSTASALIELNVLIWLIMGGEQSVVFILGENSYYREEEKKID